MKFLKTAALAGILAGTLAIGCASVQAMPLGRSAPSDVFAQLNGETSPILLQAQFRRDGRGPDHRRYQPQGRYDRGDDTGAAVAAGILGLFIGGMIAAEAQRQQQGVGYCAQRFRSYDPQSMTYLGYDGLRHPCP
jgi:hypothetical protein